MDLTLKAKEYIAAIESGKTGTELSSFFENNVVQIEYPNRLSVRGAKRDIVSILDSAEKVKKIIARQHFIIRNAFVINKTVIMEIDWSGKLAIALGHLKAGELLNAHFAMFLDYVNDKIAGVRSYDCFESF